MLGAGPPPKGAVIPLLSGAASLSANIPKVPSGNRAKATPAALNSS